MTISGHDRTEQARATKVANRKLAVRDNKQEQSALVRIIGVRMREARDLSGLSQQEAAKGLGYANSSKLAKIEGATDTNSAPLLTILRAAKLYQVSVDFLFGISDDWERDPRLAREREIGTWLRDQTQKTITAQMTHLLRLQQMIEASETASLEAMSSMEEVGKAMDRFRDMNPSFDDLIGGARMQSAITRATELAQRSMAQVKRARGTLRSAGSNDTKQLDLAL